MVDYMAIFLWGQPEIFCEGSGYSIVGQKGLAAHGTNNGDFTDWCVDVK